MSDTKYEKYIKDKVMKLNDRRPELPDLVVVISKKYSKTKEMYDYLSSDEATYTGMIRKLSSFNPNIPSPFED